jgi:hypothetical protein
MSLFSRLLGRSAPVAAKLTKPDGFVDVAIPLLADPRNGQSQFPIRAKGTLESRQIGISIAFGQEWLEGPSGTAEGLVYWGTGVLRRTGSESDHLVSALATHYGYNSFSERPMLAEIPVKVVCIEGDPRSGLYQDMRTKVFFKEEQSNRYAEVYLNVSFQRSMLEIREKSHGYRVQFIRALTEA